MADAGSVEIRLYRTTDGRVPFLDWFAHLDRSISVRVDARLARVRAGNIGDVRDLGGGLIELRLTFGAGYRLYGHRYTDAVLILLAGGDKARQRRDIQRARTYLADFLERSDAHQR